MLKEVFSLDKLQQIKTLLLVVFSFCLPLFQKISTIVLVLLIFVSFFDVKDRSKYKSITFLLPILLYFLIAISIFYGTDIELKYLEQRASLIAIPIIFFAKSIDAKVIDRILKYFVLGCFVGVLICFGNAVKNSLRIEEGEWIFQPVVNNDFSFFYAVVRDGNYFFSSFFSIIHDTIYFAIYINTALAIILYRNLWKKHWSYVVMLFLFTLVIFQLSSKIGIITCLMIYSLYVFIKFRSKKWKLGFTLFIMVLGVLLFKYNPRGKVMVDKFMKEGVSINPSQRFGYQLRLMSWDSAIELIQENPLVGIGVNNVQLELNKQYETKGYIIPLENKFNAHNQFMQIYLETGILGVVIIFLMMYMLLKDLKQSNNLFFHISFVVIFFLGFLFESVLNRYSGIAFITFFYCIIVSQKAIQKAK